MTDPAKLFPSTTSAFSLKEMYQDSIRLGAWDIVWKEYPNCNDMNHWHHEAGIRYIRWWIEIEYKFTDNLGLLNDMISACLILTSTKGEV